VVVSGSGDVCSATASYGPAPNASARHAYGHAENQRYNEPATLGLGGNARPGC